MREGMECLLSVLRGHSFSCKDVDWRALILLAEEEQVLPLFLQRVAVDTLAKEARKLLEEKRREVMIAAFLMSSALVSLLRAFAQAGIPAMPLKGPFLAERLYGDTLYRGSKDLDVLVQKKHTKAAEVLLAVEGFERVSLSGDHATQWRRGTILVELHDALANPHEFPFQLQGVWQHAILSSFQGQPAWRMTEQDELFYLCLHGVRHKFERLNYCADLSAAFQRWASCRDALPSQAATPDAIAVAILGRLMASKFDANPKRPRITGGTPQQQMWLARRAEELWANLMTKGAMTPTGAAWTSFYTSLEARPMQRWKRRCWHWLYTSTRLIDDDLTFARKLKMEKRWQAMLLRPLRILLK